MERPRSDASSVNGPTGLSNNERDSSMLGSEKTRHRAINRGRWMGYIV